MRTRLSLALFISAVVLFALASSALAAHGRAATLSAPVIHEKFTPLGCSGKPSNRSTLQMEGCAEAQILASDKQIDKLNKSIFGHLSTTSAKHDFIAGHKAWFAYRQAYCLSESDVFQGGTEAGVLDAQCAAEVNSQHVSNLRDFLSDLTDN
jgi:uncharacterized protein YecT (DUF1311 family)